MDARIFLSAVEMAQQDSQMDIEQILKDFNDIFRMRDREDEVPASWYVGFFIGAAIRVLELPKVEEQEVSA